MSFTPDDELAELDALFGYKPQKKRPVNDDVDVSDLLERMRGGVFKQESGGNYQVKPNARTGATGGFQVLPENIPAWTQTHLGRRLTREEFEADPQAQESVFTGEMGKYLKKARAKAPDDDTALRMAAAAWYGGEGRMDRYDDPVRFRPNEPSFREYTMGVLNKSKPVNRPVADNSDLAELDKLFGYTGPTKGGPSAPAGDLAELDSLFGYNGDSKGGQPSPTNPTQAPFKVNPLPPVPETKATLDVQARSVADPASPKAAILFTPGETPSMEQFDPKQFGAFPTKDGILVVNLEKARKLKLRTPQEIQTFLDRNPDGMARLIGKVDNVGNETGTGQAVMTTLPDGTEASSSIVRSPETAEMQIRIDQEAFPGSQSQIVNAQDVVQKRLQDQQSPLRPLANEVQRQQVMSSMRPGEAPTDTMLRQRREPTEAAYRDFLAQTGLPDNEASMQEFNLAQNASVQGANAQNAQDVAAYNANLRSQQPSGQGDRTTPTIRENQIVQTTEQPSAVPTRQTSDADAALAIRQEVDVAGVRGDKKEYALRKVLSDYGIPQDRINDGIQRLRAEGDLLKGDPDGNTFAVNLTKGDINWIMTGDERTAPDVMPQGEIVGRQREAESRVLAEQPVDNRAYSMATETEAEAEKLLEKRFRENDYSIQQRAAEFLSNPVNLTPLAVLNAPSIFNDVSDEWIAEEKKRLINQHGSLAKGLAAERYYQEASPVEKVARTAAQTARSFTKNLISGTGKSAVFISQLLEDANPLNRVLPDEAKIGLRNAGNYADFLTRLISSRDAGTAAREMKWAKGTDDIEKQQIFESLKEFDKAIGDDPVLKGRFLGGLADAGGSALSFIALGAVMPTMPAKLLGKSRDLSIALSGALQMTGAGYEEGKQSGLSEQDARSYGIFQGLLGTTEMLGAGAEAFKFLKTPMLRGRVANALLEVGKATGREAKQEFAQEVFQTTSGKAVLEYLKGNEPDTLTKLTNALNRLPKQIATAATNEGLYGMITGGLMGGAGKAAQVLTEQGEDTPNSSLSRTDALLKFEKDRPVAENATTDPKVSQETAKATLPPESIPADSFGTNGTEIPNVENVKKPINETKTEVSKSPAQVEPESLVQDQPVEVPDAVPVSTENKSVGGGKGSPIQATGLKGGANGPFRDAEFFRNTSQTPTFTDQGLRGLDVPTQNRMLSSMISAIHNPEVRDAIVEPVMIDVVNQLVSLKPTAQMLLHDKSVLKDPLSVNAEGAVSLRVDVADALAGIVAGLTTELSPRGRGGSESDSTLEAGVVDAGENLHTTGPRTEKEPSLILPKSPIRAVKSDATPAAIDNIHNDIISQTSKTNEVAPKDTPAPSPKRLKAKEQMAGLLKRKVVETKDEEPTVHKFSSTQVDLPKAASARVLSVGKSLIPDSELYLDPDDPSYGREEKPHVTVKYGLHTSDAAEVRPVLAEAKPFKAKLGKISIFEGKDDTPYDVVKAEIEAPELHELNKKIAESTKVTDTFPTYVPHVTLAYVKKGEGKKYVGKTDLKDVEIDVNSVTFSSKTGETVEIPLGGSLGAKPEAEIPVSEPAKSLETDYAKASKARSLAPKAENLREVKGESKSDLKRQEPVTPDGTHANRPAKILGTSTKGLKIQYLDGEGETTFVKSKDFVKDAKAFGKKSGLEKRNTPKPEGVVEPLPESQQVSVNAEPTAKEARQSVDKEKVNPRTGLTKTQTEYLAKELRDIATARLKEATGHAENEDEFQKMLLHWGDDGVPMSVFGGSSITMPESIKVPGDGSFKVGSIESANRLHQKITGKPITGMDKASNASIPQIGAKSGPGRSSKDDAYQLALELYGTPEKAIVFLTEQKELLDKDDTKGRSGLDDVINRFKADRGKTVSYGGEPLTTVGKEAKALAQKEAAVRRKGASDRAKSAYEEIENNLSLDEADVRRLMEEELPPVRKNANPRHLVALSSLDHHRNIIRQALEYREKVAPQYRDEYAAEADKSVKELGRALSGVLGYNPEVRKLGKFTSLADLKSKVTEKIEKLRLEREAAPFSKRTKLNSRLYDLEKAEYVLGFAKASSPEPKPEPEAHATPKKEPMAKAAKEPASKPKAEKAEVDPLTDFGEKIGGARKDMWAGRGLTTSDLAGMTAREKHKLVKKDQVWSKPDYQEINDRFEAAGIADPQAHAYAVKMIYDGLAQPNEQFTDEDWDAYVNGVIEVRDTIGERLQTPTATWYEGLMTKLFGEDIVYRTGGRYLNPKAEGYAKPRLIGSTKFINAIPSSDYSIRQAKSKADKINFPSKREAWMNKFAVQRGELLGVSPGSRWIDGERVKYYSVSFYGKGTGWVNLAEFETEQEATDFKKTLFGKWALVSARSPKEWKGEQYKLFESEAEAVAEAKSLNKKATGKREDEPTRPQLEGINREGTDYRKGKPATPEQFTKTFGFRGVEFGNWLNAADRQQSLDHAFDALMDLAGVLKVAPRALSLNGNLGLAFGARGKGGKSAGVAHYEPSKVVINLTKMAGAGSLAHEWGHAVDDYFGSLAAKANYRTDPHKGYASQGSMRSGLRPEMQEAWRNVVSSILEREATPEEAVLDAKKAVAKQQAIWDSWIKYIYGDADGIREANKKFHEAIAQGVTINTGPYSEFAKAAGKIKGIKSKQAKSLNQIANQIIRAQTDLQKAIAGEMVKKIPTNFKDHAKNLDTLFRSKPYFDTTLELFARAFESYVQDKTGGKSQYLVHGTDTKTSNFPKDLVKSMANFEKGISDEEAGNTLPINMYPEGQERDFINAAFDNFVETLEQVETDDGNVILRSVPEKTDDILAKIVDDRGKIDYEQVKDVAGRVERGELEIVRLDRQGERGRIAGGRRNVEASLILGANEGTGKAASRGGGGLEARADKQSQQEKLLTDYAREQGIQFNYNRIDNRGEFIGSGVEARVYRDESGTAVIKLVDYKQINKGATPLDFLDRISLFNHLFPESAYELVGFTRDDTGLFRFIVKQPFIIGGPVSQHELEKMMEQRGLYNPTHPETFSNPLYTVFDLHYRNVLKDAADTVFVIDAVPRMNSTALQRFSVEEAEQADDGNVILRSVPGYENVEFEQRPVVIEELLKRDRDLREYVEKNNPEPSQKRLKPIVLAMKPRGGIVVEGMERIAQAISNGKRVIDAFVQAGEPYLRSVVDDDTAEQRRLWKDRVNDFYKGNKWKNPVEIFDRTPAILRKLGVPSRSLYVTPSVVEKLKGDHGLSAANVSALFDDLIDPMMVLESATKSDSKVVVTGQKDYKGDPIIVAIKPNGEVTLQTSAADRTPKNVVKANILTSAYGKPNAGLQRWIDEGLLLYRNTEKGKTWWHGQNRLQLPTRDSRDTTSKKKILTQVDFVNTSLYKVKTPDAVRELEDLAKVDDFTDLIPKVETSVDGNILHLDSPEAVEWMRTVMAFSEEADRAKAPIIQGTFLSPKNVQQVVDAAYGALEAVQEAEIDAGPIERLIKNLETAMSANAAGTVILDYFDDALPHEQVHEGSYLGADGKPYESRYANAKEIKADKTFKKFHKALNRMQGKSSHGVAMEEALAYLGTGDYARFGLSKDEAVELLAKLVEGYAAQNGVESLSNFKEGTELYERIEAFRKSQRESRSDGGRSEVSGERETGRETAEREPAEDAGRERRPEGSSTADGATKPQERVKGQRVAAFSRILGEDYYYDPQGHEETEAKAQQLISDKGVEQAIWEALNGKPSAETMRVVYWELERLNGLADHYLESGEQEAFNAVAEQIADLSSNIVARQVSAGREIEIAKTLMPLSPEVAILTATKMKKFATGDPDASLTDLQTKQIVEIAKALKESNQKLAEAEQTLRKAERKIKRLESDKEPTRRTPQAKRLKEYQKRKPELLRKLQEVFPDSPMFNGEKSALMMVPPPSKQTETPAFKRWFKDSKVVDENGEPLVVYHGTNTDFDVHDSRTFPTAGYFAKDPGLASYVARGRAEFNGGQANVRPSYLSLQNPIDLSDMDGVGLFTTDELLDQLPFEVDNTFRETFRRSSYGRSPQYVWSFIGSPDLIRLFKSKGYDGAIYNEGTPEFFRNAMRPDTFTDTKSYVAFEPNQIKSAIGNDGNFDENEPSILRSVAGPELEPEQVALLTEYAEGMILEGRPYEQVIQTLTDIAGTADVRGIHAAAVENMRSDRTMSDETKEKLKIRNEHYRQAEKFTDPEGTEKRIKSLEESIERLRKKINSRDLSTKRKDETTPKMDELIAERKQLQKELNKLRREATAKPKGLSGIAQDAKDAGYDDDLVHAIDRLTGDKPKDINQVVRDLREELDLDIEQASTLARKANQIVGELRRERRRRADELQNILPEMREALNRAKIAKARATYRMNRFLNQMANKPWLMERFNNDFRAKLVSNWGTQMFNAVQGVISTGTESVIDLMEATIKLVANPNPESTLDISAKDAWLPLAYIFSSNKQIGEQVLADFPEEYYKIHSGLLGDIELDLPKLAEDAPLATKPLHAWFDKMDWLNRHLAKISGAKMQEMHFRNAMVAASFDQVVRKKSGGKETLKTALANGTMLDYVTERDAKIAADKALRVTFAALIDDPVGRELKRWYDKMDKVLPVMLNPVTFARFTYTTTRVMVANPLLGGILDSERLGGEGYNARSIAKGVLAWGGVAMAYGLLSAFGDDDDRWETLTIDGTTYDVRRFFPISAFFYVAHIIKSQKEGRPLPSGEDILAGFASLELDYYQFGPAVKMLETAQGYYNDTKSASDLGADAAAVVGNYFSGILRVLKPAKDVLAQIDPEPLREPATTAGDKFLAEVSKTLPYVSRAMSTDVKKDVLTGEPITMPFPIGRPFGINVVHPTFLKPQPSPATEWAMKFFKFEGGGEFTAEDRIAYDIKTQLKKAQRAGKLTPEKANEIINEAIASGKLKKTQLGRLQDEMKLSELQSRVKYFFGFNDKSDLEKLRKIWRRATDQEKDDLRQVLRRKKGRDAKFNEEFGIPVQAAAQIRGAVTIPD